jgi:hypothetical protein
VLYPIRRHLIAPFGVQLFLPTSMVVPQLSLLPFSLASLIRQILRTTRLLRVLIEQFCLKQLPWSQELTQPRRNQRISFAQGNWVFDLNLLLSLRAQLVLGWQELKQQWLLNGCA